MNAPLFPAMVDRKGCEGTHRISNHYRVLRADVWEDALQLRYLESRFGQMF